MATTTASSAGNDNIKAREIIAYLITLVSFGTTVALLGVLVPTDVSRILSWSIICGVGATLTTTAMLMSSTRGTFDWTQLHIKLMLAFGASQFFISSMATLYPLSPLTPLVGLLCIVIAYCGIMLQREESEEKSDGGHPGDEV